MVGYQPSIKEHVIDQIKVWDLWPFFWHFEDVIELRYMSHREIVEEQIAALYAACQEMRFEYVSTPYASDPSLQAVKYPSATLNDKNGNCIDLTVMFASALERLNMRPQIILVPGHAFLGCRKWSDPDEYNSDESVYLETTMVGKFPADDALKEGQRTHIINKKENELKIIDVWECRKLGIDPAFD